MPNPLFNMLGGGQLMPDNIQRLRQQYEAFRLNTQGDPLQIIQQMLQNGRISQAQLDRAQMLANQFANLLN